MTIETLLAPVNPEQPCGENLEYDAEFQALEQASQGKAEQQFGDTIIPAEPADWNRVEKLATALLSRTKDLRVMVALTHAWTRRQGLEGYANGLSLIEQALEIYWEALWPALTENGEYDPFYRINALASIGDKSALTTTLRQCVLLRSNGDEISVRDAQALLDGSKTECAGFPGGRARLVDELARTGEGDNSIMRRIHLSLIALRDGLVDKLSESGAPEMDQLIRTTALITSVSTAPLDEAPVTPADAAPEAALVTPQPARSDWRSTEITSRADAQLMLEKVKLYFTRHEPSHPAPLMIDRVQRLIEQDFMAIIRDLAPDGVQQLENIFGRHS
ncbi:type VI secretion system protein TssA [Yokenella regensburgei]|uniref:type VI secretion system protein TssA n=1 Tax=Yokenella regensburgei TaxID=158877 RepID=UPI003F1770DB